MRLLKNTAVGLVLLALCALAAMFVADPLVTRRMVVMAVGGSLGPEDPVPGGTPVVVAVADDARRTVSAQALQQAIDYGTATKSHALLVWHDGALQLEHYWPGHGPSSHSSTQSMAKTVLAFAVGAAIRDGRIGSVDDPVARYLPEWSGDARGRITIRQLLQQASGLAFPRANYWNPSGTYLQVMLGGELEKTLLAQPAEAAPGRQFDYNNVNAGILGLVVERATGMPYAKYLSQAVWQRIGASDATQGLDSLAHRTPRTFCCFGADARSWLQVGRLILDEGAVGDAQVLPREWMREMTTPSALNRDYGYLLWLGTEHQPRRRYNHKTETSVLHSEAFAAPDVRYLDGFGGQRVYVIPSKRLVIVRTGDIAMDWDDARLPNLIVRGLHAD